MLDDDEWTKHPLLSAAGVHWKEQDWKDRRFVFTQSLPLTANPILGMQIIISS